MSTESAMILPDSDILQIVKYLTFQYSAEEVAAFEDRLTTDVAFRMYALPLIVVWTIPHPLAARGFLRGFRLRRSKPNSMKLRQREWVRLFRAADMKPQPMAKVLDDAFHPPRRAKKIFWTTVGSIFVFVVLWIAIWWRIAQSESLKGRSVPGEMMIVGARFYDATTTTRTVSRGGATYTLQPNSRVVITLVGPIAAIEGDVDIVVHPGRRARIQPAGIITMLSPGRYRVWHLAGTSNTRVLVDSGSMRMNPIFNPDSPIKFFRFTTGAAVNAVQRDGLTTLSAVYKDGRVMDTVTVLNKGIRP